MTGSFVPVAATKLLALESTNNLRARAKLTKKEEPLVRRLLLFLVLFVVPVWFLSILSVV